MIDAMTTKGTKPKKSVKREKFLYMKGSTPTLSWRLDPDDSLSDWTLRIVHSEHPRDVRSSRFSKEAKNRGRALGSLSPTRSSPLRSAASSLANPIKTYFVHRSVLGVGPRSSEYFAQLFKNAATEDFSHTMDDARDDHDQEGISRRIISGNPTNVTKIELLPSAASCFPAMLDYMYAAPGTPLDISSANAVALRHLASSFGIKSLFHETTDFIKKDLTPETAPLYLMEARKFKNEKVSSTAIKAIASNFKTVKLTALSSLPSQYLIDIFTSGHLKMHHDDTGEKLSTKIAAYCRCRGNEITLSMLETLTAPQFMTTIAEEESLYFLNLFLRLGGDQDVDDKGLFARCLDQAPALLKKVRFGCTDSKDDHARLVYRQRSQCNEIYNQLPDWVKVQLLERVPSHETAPPVEIQSSSNFSTNVGEKKAKKQIAKMRNEMEEMQAVYEKKVGYLTQKLGRKDEELRRSAVKHQRSKKMKDEQKRESFESPNGCHAYI